MNEPLTQLKDIHLPVDISWWPPAPGWWLLLLLLIVTVIGLVRYWRHYSSKKSLLREALNALDKIQQDWQQHKDAGQLVTGLSLLLRRVAISKYPGSDIAGKTGESWLHWLDQQLGEQEFEKGDGRLLMDAPYRSEVSLDKGDSLIALVRRWIDKVARGHHA
jgi:hypothetical protein